MIDNLTRLARFGSFSALQRAENSSIVRLSVAVTVDVMFQCSSASRKFLNFVITSLVQTVANACFSALQRAENSSIDQCTIDR